jgi:hypothetical protein
MFALVSRRSSTPIAAIPTVRPIRTYLLLPEEPANTRNYRGVRLCPRGSRRPWGKTDKESLVPMVQTKVVRVFACGVGIVVRFQGTKVNVTCITDKAVITLPLLTSICRLPYVAPPISSPFPLCTDTPATATQLKRCDLPLTLGLSGRMR